MQSSHRGGSGSQHAVHIAGQLERSRRFGIHAGEAWATLRPDRHHHAIAADRGAIDPGRLLLNAKIVEKVPRFEVIRAIENQIATGQ